MKISVVAGNPLAQQSGILFVFVTQQAADKSFTQTATLKKLDHQLKGLLFEQLDKEKFKGGADDAKILFTRGLAPYDYIAIVGLGDKKKVDVEKLRRAAARLPALANANHAGKVTVDVDEAHVGRFSVSELAQAVVEGLRLSSYQFSRYKKAKETFLKEILNNPANAQGLVIRFTTMGILQGAQSARYQNVTIPMPPEKAESLDVLKQIGLTKGKYAVVTLHRPSNVDSKTALTKLLSILKGISKNIRIVFPIHPRTRKRLEEFGLLSLIKKENILLIDPQGYLEFLCLMSNSKFVLTDSGGIQEETTVLGIPCITLRENTERPITVDEGTNMLISTNEKKVLSCVDKILSGKAPKGRIPKLWDGRAAKRIADVIVGKFGE